MIDDKKIEEAARTASCMAAIPTARYTASTPLPTARSFSWWTWMARRSYAYAKPPSRATPIAPCPGAADLSYPSSALRRSRTVGGGKLVNALTAASSGICLFVEL